MRPETVGRVLGIGLRVAGRVAGQRIGGSERTAVPAAGAHRIAPEQGPRQTVLRSPGNLVRGVGGFLRPFRRLGGILWLEVTGVFFFLPVVVFAPTLWRTRSSLIAGPDHRTSLASAVVVVVFFYLGVTSFWRARRRAAAQAAEK
jgi:hypothetical protein